MEREFPEATHLSRSWVVIGRGGRVLAEVFCEKIARSFHDRGISIVLIGEHLVSLNKKED